MLMNHYCNIKLLHHRFINLLQNRLINFYKFHEIIINNKVKHYVQEQNAIKV
jgi:hypothetical protein